MTNPEMTTLSISCWGCLGCASCGIGVFTAFRTVRRKCNLM